MRRDYVHVDDLAEAHVLALEFLVEGGKSIAVNLGTGQGHSIRDSLVKIAEISGQERRFFTKLRRDVREIRRHWSQMRRWRDLMQNGSYE